MNIQSKPNYYLLLFVVFGGFLLFGLSENIKGPAIPVMQSELALSNGMLGLLLAINAFGFLLACTYTSWLIDKIGAKTTSIVTFLLMGVSGVLIYFSNDFPSLMGAYFLLYLGNGMLEIGLAIIAARIFTKHTGTMLNLSHFFYGLSSTIAPIAAAHMMGWEISASVVGWRGMYMIMLSLSLLPMIPVMLSRFPKGQSEEEDRTSIKKLTKDPLAWLIVFSLTMGVTAELGIAAWLVNYLVSVNQWTLEDASTLLGVFFFMFMLARLLLGPVTDRFGYTISIIVFSAFAGMVSMIPIVAGERFAILFAVAGFGIGPIYPTMMALLAKRYKKGTDAAITFTVTLMGIGGVITHLMIGYLIEFVTNLSLQPTIAASNQLGMKAGYLFIALTALLCSLATVLIYRRLKKENNLL